MGSGSLCMYLKAVTDNTGDGTVSEGKGPGGQQGPGTAWRKRESRQLLQYKQRCLLEVHTVHCDQDPQIAPGSGRHETAAFLVLLASP